jgi:trans-aconitate methyltransferase
MPPDAFAHRAQLTELMDEPSRYEEFRDCLRDLERVNKTVLSYRPTLRWLRQFAVPRPEPLHIVDVGSGGGDMLRRIEHWARLRLFDVHLTGMDANPHATRAAREFSLPSSRIQWVTANALRWTPSRPVDIILSSLFTHHLTDEEIVHFLEWMEKTARRGWFINDLSRGRISYYGFKLLARLKHWHRFVQHDGPVSIQRSFRPEDWQRYIAAAGLDPNTVRIQPAWPGRLCVGRVKA